MIRSFIVLVWNIIWFMWCFFCDTLDFMNKGWFKISALVIIPIFLFWLMFVNYLEPTQVGIARNIISGKMWLQKEGGFYITPPWVFVIRIPTHPMRVSMMSGGKGYSAKLVEFQSDYWREFVDVEGFRYYWWSNRFSINFGYTEEYRGIKDIFRGHAYGAKQYKFIKITEEYTDTLLNQQGKSIK